MVAEGANERALFTGSRNLVIEQFENESWFGQWREFAKICENDVPTSWVIVD